MQHANHFRFDVGHSIKRIHQQPARSLVHRQGHCVHREVAAAQIFDDRRGSDLRSLARLVIDLRARHGNLGAHPARQRQQQRPRVVVGVPDDRARLLQVFSELERVALHREVEIADGEPGNDVADGAARQVQVHLRRLRGVGHEGDCLLLIRREPGFQRVYVVGHAFLVAVRYPSKGIGRGVFHSFSTGVRPGLRRDPSQQNLTSSIH